MDHTTPREPHTTPQNHAIVQNGTNLPRPDCDCSYSSAWMRRGTSSRRSLSRRPQGVSSTPPPPRLRCGNPPSTQKKTRVAAMRISHPRRGKSHRERRGTDQKHTRKKLIKLNTRANNVVAWRCSRRQDKSHQKRGAVQKQRDEKQNAHTRK